MKPWIGRLEVEVPLTRLAFFRIVAEGTLRWVGIIFRSYLEAM